MKKLLKFIVPVMLIAIWVISMSGCAAMEEQEAKNLVNHLVNKSYELNIIYFGEGLAMQENDGKELYVPVAGNSNYTTKLSLVEKTKEIFSEDYANDIIDIAFNGGSGAVGTEAVFARYIEYDGHLCIRRDIDVINVAKYDYSTTTIEKCSNRFIRAKIKTSNLEENVYVEIVLINEENGWRIDSATY